MQRRVSLVLYIGTFQILYFYANQYFYLYSYFCQLSNKSQQVSKQLTDRESARSAGGLRAGVLHVPACGRRHALGSCPAGWVNTRGAAPLEPTRNLQSNAQQTGHAAKMMPTSFLLACLPACLSAKSTSLMRDRYVIFAVQFNMASTSLVVQFAILQTLLMRFVQISVDKRLG